MPLETHTGKAYAPVDVTCPHWRHPTPTSGGDPSNLAVVVGFGRFLISGGYLDHTLKVHLLSNNQCIASLRPHPLSTVTVVRVSSDLRTVVTGAADGAVALWPLSFSANPPLAADAPPPATIAEVTSFCFF